MIGSEFSHSLNPKQTFILDRTYKYFVLGFMLDLTLNNENMRYLGTIKIISKQHVKDFVNEGRLLISRQDVFHQDLNSAYTDKYEGLKEIYQPNSDVEFTINGHTLNTADFAGPATMHSFEYHLFCLLAFKESNVFEIKNSGFPKELYDFGDTVVVFHDMNKFKKKLSETGVQFRGRGVEYIDFSTYSGEVKWYQNSEKIMYQDEYRFAFPSFECQKLLSLGGDNRRCFLQLGDLSDIVTVMPIEDFVDAFDIVEKR